MHYLYRPKYLPKYNHHFAFYSADQRTIFYFPNQVLLLCFLNTHCKLQSPTSTHNSVSGRTRESEKIADLQQQLRLARSLLLINNIEHGRPAPGGIDRTKSSPDTRRSVQYFYYSKSVENRCCSTLHQSKIVVVPASCVCVCVCVLIAKTTFL